MILSGITENIYYNAKTNEIYIQTFADMFDNTFISILLNESNRFVCYSGFIDYIGEL